MYALFDIDKQQLTFHRVSYNNHHATAAIRLAHLPSLFCGSTGAWPMKLLEPGAELDGFTIDECVHSGGMAHIYRVHYTQGASDGAKDAGFPLAMKVPRMTAHEEGDGAENIVSFEVEHQIMQVLSGPHVPRFVAAGDLENVPFLVMEYVPRKNTAGLAGRTGAPKRRTSGPPWRGRGAGSAQPAPAKHGASGFETGQCADA